MSGSALAAGEFAQVQAGNDPVGGGVLIWIVVPTSVGIVGQILG